MINYIVIAFLLLMAWFWSGQGLLSSFIHLVLTIFAGVIALALWEPLVYGFLLHRMPETAWGTGLVALFVLALLGLRTVADKYVPGNVNHHNLVNKIGGGTLGFCSGVLTAGLLVIGLQMIGLPDLAGYAPFKLATTVTTARNTTVELQATQTMWVPVDTIAANFFSGLSAGSMSPVLSSADLAELHPNLAVEAAFFHVDAYVDNPGKRTLDPANVELLKDSSCVFAALPPSLTGKLDPSDQKRTVAIGTKITINVPGTSPASDGDGLFRISQSQVALLYNLPDDGGTGVSFPTAYIQNGVLVTFNTTNRALCDKDAATYHWVFQIPAKASPRFLRLKGLRVNLPDHLNTDSAVAERLIHSFNLPGTTEITGSTPGNSGAPGGPSGLPGGAAAKLVEVSDRLPWIVNRNIDTQNVTTQEDAISSGTGTFRQPRERVGSHLEISRLNHPKSMRIVRVNLGKKSGQSLLGRVMAFTATHTQPPVLIDAQGSKYFAIGWCIVRGAQFRLSFEPSQPLQALSQVLGAAGSDDPILLYYQVPVDTTLVTFEIGGQKQSLNITVK